MVKSLARLAACALLAGAGAACQKGLVIDGPKGSSSVVQIGSITMDNTSVSCTDPQGGVEQKYTITFSVEMVNTTDNDVTVMNVSSNGNIAASTLAQSDVGKPAHVFDALPFTPTPALVRAHDGDLTLRVPMTVGCGTAEVTNPFSRQIVMSLRVTTNSGQYQSLPIAINGTWTHAELMPSVRKRG